MLLSLVLRNVVPGAHISKHATEIRTGGPDKEAPGPTLPDSEGCASTLPCSPQAARGSVNREKSNLMANISEFTTVLWVCFGGNSSASSRLRRLPSTAGGLHPHRHVEDNLQPAILSPGVESQETDVRKDLQTGLVTEMPSVTEHRVPRVLLHKGFAGPLWLSTGSPSHPAMRHTASLLSLFSFSSLCADCSQKPENIPLRRTQPAFPGGFCACHPQTGSEPPSVCGNREPSRNC